jgi:hypothetical protein
LRLRSGLRKINVIVIVVRWRTRKRIVIGDSYYGALSERAAKAALAKVKRQ